MWHQWSKLSRHATYTQGNMKIVPHGCNLSITSKQSYKDKHFLRMPTMLCALFATSYQVFFNIVYVEFLDQYVVPMRCALFHPLDQQPFNQMYLSRLDDSLIGTKSNCDDLTHLSKVNLNVEA